MDQRPDRRSPSTSASASPNPGAQRSGSSEGRRSAAASRKRGMKLPEFVDATAFFGLEPHQATHFFGVMDADGNGSLTMHEFVEALTQMPEEVLLQDLRQRL